MNGRVAGIFLYLTCIVGVSSSDEQPNMETSMISIATDQGKVAILPCMVSDMDMSKYKVIWYHPSKSLISVNQRIVGDTRKYSLLQPYATDWNLKIYNVRDTDSGAYKCHLNTRPVQSKNVQLRVLVPPRIQSSSHTEVETGKSFTLFCNATGDPSPSISWLKGGKVLPQFQSGVLTKDNATLNDAGDYRCKADNGVGSAAYATIAVDVLYSPNVSAKQSRIGQKKYKDVVLECEVSANPTATVTWYKEATAIVPTWKYRPENISSFGGNITHLLTIKSLDAYDFGDYICMANNKIGSRSGMFTVYELVTSKETAAPPSTITYTVAKSTTKHPTREKGSTVKYTEVEGNDGITGQISSPDNSAASLHFSKHILFCTLIVACIKCIYR